MNNHKSFNRSDKRILFNTDGYLLGKCIQALKNTKEFRILDDGSCSPSALTDCFCILEGDSKCEENYNKYCAGVLYTEMNPRQIRTTLTYLQFGINENGNHFLSQIPVDEMLKLLLRLDDLLIMFYQERKVDVKLRHNIDYDKDGKLIFWFEKNDDGNAVLVRPSGKQTVFTEKNDVLEMTDFGQEGWQRAMLFAKLFDCGDTDFACAMDTTIGTAILLDEKKGMHFSYIFDTPQSVERFLREKLTDEQIEKCKNYVGDFLKHSELQRICQDIVLHNVCFKFYEDNTLEPFPMSRVPADILKNKYMQRGALGRAGTVDWKVIQHHSQMIANRKRI